MHQSGTSILRTSPLSPSSPKTLRTWRSSAVHVALRRTSTQAMTRTCLTQSPWTYREAPRHLRATLCRTSHGATEGPYVVTQSRTSTEHSEIANSWPVDTSVLILMSWSMVRRSGNPSVAWLTVLHFSQIQCRTQALGIQRPSKTCTSTCPSRTRNWDCAQRAPLHVLVSIVGAASRLAVFKQQSLSARAADTPSRGPRNGRGCSCHPLHLVQQETRRTGSLKHGQNVKAAFYTAAAAPRAAFWWKRKCDHEPGRCLCIGCGRQTFYGADLCPLHVAL